MIRLLWLWMGYIDEIKDVENGIGILAQIERSSSYFDVNYDVRSIIVGGNVGDADESLHDMFMNPGQYPVPVPTTRWAHHPPNMIDAPFGGGKIPFPAEVYNPPLQIIDHVSLFKPEEPLNEGQQRMLKEMQDLCVSYLVRSAIGQQDNLERQEEND